MDIAERGLLRQWLEYSKTKEELKAKRLGIAYSSGRKKEEASNARASLLEEGKRKGEVSSQRGEKRVRDRPTALRQSVTELKQEVERLRKSVTAVHTRQNSQRNQESLQLLSATKSCLGPDLKGTLEAKTLKRECCSRNTEKSASTTSSAGDASGNGEDWWKAHTPTLPIQRSTPSLCPSYYLLVSQPRGQLLYKDTPLHLGLTSHRSTGFHLYTSLSKAAARAVASSVILQAEPKGKVLAAGEDEAVTGSVTPVRVLK